MCGPFMAALAGAVREEGGAKAMTKLLRAILAEPKVCMRACVHGAFSGAAGTGHLGGPLAMGGPVLCTLCMLPCPACSWDQLLPPGAACMR